MKPLTDEEVDALWLQIMGGSIREYNPMKAREYRAMVRAGMMKAAEIAGDAGSDMASRDHSQGVMDAMNAIIATLERELEVVRAQRDEHARWRSDLADKLHVAEAQLAERTKEMDEARTYCAGLASYICEPIYDDVANRRGVQADAQAAAGGAAVERWANADKQRLRAESAEQQVRALREILLELVDERSSADHWTRRAEVYEKARAALAQQEGGE